LVKLFVVYVSWWKSLIHSWSPWPRFPFRNKLRSSYFGRPQGGPIKLCSRRWAGNRMENIHVNFTSRANPAINQSPLITCTAVQFMPDGTGRCYTTLIVSMFL
jgi:hypothetical protein